MSDIEKKELNEEELGQVAGGSGGEHTTTKQGHTFTGHIGQYNLQWGRYYWITGDHSDAYIHAYVIRSFERDNLLFGTTRVHQIRDDYTVEGDRKEFENECIFKDKDDVLLVQASEVTVYLYRDGAEA